MSDLGLRHLAPKASILPTELLLIKKPPYYRVAANSTDTYDSVLPLVATGDSPIAGQEWYVPCYSRVFHKALMRSAEVSNPKPSPAPTDFKTGLQAAAVDPPSFSLNATGSSFSNPYTAYLTIFLSRILQSICRWNGRAGGS